MSSALTIGLLAPALLGAAARADVAPPDRALDNDRLLLGLASDGSLGNSSTDLGVLFDPDGPDGEMPLGGDVLTVGRVFEVWSLSAQVDGADWTVEQTEPWAGSDLVLEWESGGAHELSWLHGVGGDDTLLVDTWVVVRHGLGVAWLVMDLEALVDIEDLWLTRAYDPDLDDWIDDSTSTSNVVGEGVVVASGAWDGRSWALASPDGTGGICSWCTLPTQVIDGQTTSEGDDQLGITVEVGDLLAGDSSRVVFAYAFGPDADSTSDQAQAAAASEDLDGDGSDWWTDCDDLDPLIGPDQLEDLDNGIDDDCDGEVDEADDSSGGDTGERDDWDQEIPGDGGAGDGGSSDGGSSDGGSSDGGATDGGATDGGAADGGAADGGTADGGGDDEGKGCSHLSASPAVLTILMLGLPLVARRRT